MTLGAADEDGEVDSAAVVAGAISGFTIWGASFWVVAGAEVRRLIPGGRGTCLAFSYKPQALQIIFPLISRRHKGVELVPQFLLSVNISFWGDYEQTCPDIEVDRVSVVVPVIVIWSEFAKDTVLL